ncbi:hypothetical protein BJ165DRAFT_1178222 [Panaeolus papilionaceus]|nr:hypothetical protein BJ165DRAFT_1178222 [Panaeolus papilionaceus]
MSATITTIPFNRGARKAMDHPLVPLGEVVRRIQDQLASSVEIRLRLSFHNIHMFARNLALVALGVRTGYLLDIFILEKPFETFDKILLALRSSSQTTDYFSEVIHLHEPVSQQSFFLNTRLTAASLSRTLLGADHGSDDIAFIKLSEPPEIMDGPPDTVLQVCTTLSQQLSDLPLSTSFSLPENTPATVSVPVAAILLDYPVAYVPNSTDGGPLSNVSLNFYEAILTWSSEVTPTKHNKRDITQHSVMKFSCPSSLSEVDHLSPRAITNRLQIMFQERSTANGVDGSIEIIHSTATVPQLSF